MRVIRRDLYKSSIHGDGVCVSHGSVLFIDNCETGHCESIAIDKTEETSQLSPGNNS